MLFRYLNIHIGHNRTQIGTYGIPLGYSVTLMMLSVGVVGDVFGARFLHLVINSLVRNMPTDLSPNNDPLLPTIRPFI